MQVRLDWVKCLAVRQLFMRLPARLVGSAEDVRWQVQGGARADGPNATVQEGAAVVGI
jgi:hypothetical protein